jgi:hypothetical protein
VGQAIVFRGLPTQTTKNDRLRHPAGGLRGVSKNGAGFGTGFRDGAGRNPRGAPTIIWLQLWD